MCHALADKIFKCVSYQAAAKTTATALGVQGEVGDISNSRQPVTPAGDVANDRSLQFKYEDPFGFAIGINPDVVGLARLSINPVDDAIFLFDIPVDRDRPKGILRDLLQPSEIGHFKLANYPVSHFPLASPRLPQALASRKIVVK